MPTEPQSSGLKKELGLFDVFVIAAATLSSGFFLLPGLAAVSAGPALPLAYLLAALLLIPGLMSKAELATAMPRAGGVYYFLDRSMGPLVGTIGGLGTWLALVLKSAFALIGVGAYLALYLPNVPLVPIAAGSAVLFGLINFLGARKSSSLQAVLVLALLALLFWFTGVGAFQVKAVHFRGFFEEGASSLIATTGLVIVSYMGVSKVASISEEVKNPERNIPLGMFLALGVIIFIYTAGTAVMVGVVSAETLALNGGDLTPVATVAEVLVGPWGVVLMTVGAVLAFSSVANAGILSASRYPMAMSRDKLLPEGLSRITKRGIPGNAVVVTVAAIAAIVLLFDPTKIAKLGSAFNLLMFILMNLAVIVMRESRIQSYDPGYRAPWYPWLQILGVVSSIWFIGQMGLLALTFVVGVVGLGAVWYFYYARDRVVREGAIYHVFARLAERRFEGLDRELRQILKEKGLRAEDPFDEVVARGFVIDLKQEFSFEEIIHKASGLLARRVPASKDELIEGFMRGTQLGVTPVSHGAALPHVRLAGLMHPEVVLVRSRSGVRIATEGAFFADQDPEDPIYALFLLVSPERDPGQHLRMLAQIAGRIDDEGFMAAWLDAEHEQDLKEILLRDERFLSLRVRAGAPTERYIGKAVRDLGLPEGCLIALVRRESETVIPRGSTILQEGDRLTIIGDPALMRKLSRAHT